MDQYLQNSSRDPVVPAKDTDFHGEYQWLSFPAHYEQRTRDSLTREYSMFILRWQLLLP